MDRYALMLMISLVFFFGVFLNGAVSAGRDIAPATPETQAGGGWGDASPSQPVGLTATRTTTLTAYLYLPLIIRMEPPAPPPTVYVDHFDDPQSGWHVGPAMRYDTWCSWQYGCFEGWEEVTTLSYEGGHYRFYVPLTWHGGGKVDTWFVWPIETAPLPDTFYPLPQNYCIETRGYFVGTEEYAPWWAHWGIVFGADADLSEAYSMQVNANHDTAILYHHNYQYPGNRQPLGGEDINVEVALAPWAGDNSWIYSHQYNKLKVVVQGRLVKAFVNDRLVNSIRIPNDLELPRDHIGLIGGSWEVTPIDIRIDYFLYDPTCPEAQP